MTITDIKNEECFGCRACESVCPATAISMQFNDEGFLYPCVEANKCISCGRCWNVCPRRRENDLNESLDCYAAVSCDGEIRRLSSSGGVFASIATDFLKKGGFVVGATMLDDYKVKHIIINSLDQLHLLQGSKYVQSDLNSVHEQIFCLLKEGHKVLFSGTPCQVSGLLTSLSEKKVSLADLYTIDIICTGVPSPVFLEKHILKCYGKVSDLRFRHRTIHELNCYAIGYLKGNNYKIKSPAYRDLYFSCFLNHISFRESCYKCFFAQKKRIGDITLGDMNTHRFYENILGTDKSISIVSVNTKKGEILLNNDVALDKVPAIYEIESNMNQALNSPPERPKERSVFYKELFSDGGYHEKNIVRFAYQPSAKDVLRTLIIQLTTQKSRKKIKKLLYSVYKRGE